MPFTDDDYVKSLLYDFMAYYGVVNPTGLEVWFKTCEVNLKNDNDVYAAIIICFQKLSSLPTIEEFINLARQNINGYKCNRQAWELIFSIALLENAPETLEKAATVKLACDWLESHQHEALYRIGGFSRIAQSKVTELPQLMQLFLIYCQESEIANKQENN